VRESFSAAVSYNVLEHIDDDIGALRSMAALVRPGGHVIIVVPAFEWAMSPADVATGHVRRYTRKSMRAAMEAAGLEIVKLHYANTVGLVGYVITTKILRLMPGPGKIVWVYDRFVAPVTRLVERLVTPPFGQSVVAIARVPER
jgi:2-polyprenyl-3-methyl-5-hydroxy-6-metoxy-1,4-benzoquinol methylase